MSAIAEQVEPARERFARLAPRLPGSEVRWVAAMRRGALEAFVKRGIPTPREERWKYTDVTRHASRLTAEVPMTPAALPDADGLAARAPFGAEGTRLVFVDGCFVPRLSRLEGLPAGVRVTPMSAALDEGSAELEAHLHDFRESGSFSALNLAFMRDGALVELAPGAKAVEPIHLLFLGSGGERACHTRNMIVAGEGSELTLVEHYAGTAGGGFTNAVTDIELMAGARVEHCRLQEEHGEQVHVGSVHARQRRDSRLVSHSVALGAQLSRVDINAGLNGERAACELNGLFFAGGRQHVDHHTLVDHVHPNCASDEFYKGVLDGRARGVFNGRVVVHEGAQKTQAAQSNGNLLLSRKAEVDTKPELEIYADDVKCSHGATTGQLNEDHVFYLRARGLGEAEARNVLTFAFADDVLRRIPHAPLRRYIEEAVLPRLPGGEEMKGLL